MQLPTLMNPAKMSPARRERFAYWKGVPLSRLYSLLLAVFFTFGVIGLLTSALAAGRTPPVLAVGWACLSGGIAVCYVLVTARKPSLFLLLVVVQVLATGGYSALVNYIVDRNWLKLLPEHTALGLYLFAAIAFVAAGYTFFLVFIQTEGRQTIKAQAELAMAHSIQQTLVPRIELRTADYEIFGISLPSDKVGGDVVDAVVLPDGSVAAYVADVAGHGLQAGILMGMVKTAARTRLLDYPSPSMLFASLNRVMPAVKEAHMYATCAAFHLPISEAGGGRKLEFAVAGHPPVLRIGELTGADYLADEQLPLGLFPFAEYRSQIAVCSPGDLLVIATDGVLEVEGINGEEFGAARLEALVRAEKHRELPDLAEKILSSANSFGKQTDDQTLLLIRLL
jgi:hypothetical protein